ncbi:hypothetical protein [Dyadobacter arcticus]|uniref:Tetratricopeptide (TPR) repeat protein n=1 Tax=Dyadobacter arcticus TaxID=1078754 RepID=A0ABX0UHP6_9BACT|nr:hypothetical protein [Dyadobacter arcticus]NIJ52297.1 tetratricopeptide (TPR) repeat protein [Dyadobacter arcticus]
MIKSLYFCFLFLIASVVPLAAQELPVAHYKYQVTSGVIRQVSLGFDDLRQVPKLVMPMGKSNRIARFSPEPEAQLIIDEKLYDVCRQMGRDSLSALAFIISHELTHFFVNHRHPFGFATPGNELSERNKEMEKEADLYGLIQAFATGYQTFKVARPLLKKIYTAYQLPDSLKGYPTREERLVSIDLYAQQAQQLASTFEVGKFLYLKGEYAAAEHCFSDLSSRIPAKEFLNNLGLSQLQQVLTGAWIKTRSMPFKLPAELDTENRLLGKNRQGNEEEGNEFEALLEGAIRNFEKAVALDKTYMAAHINLATSMLLLNRNGTVREMIDQLQQTRTTISPDAFLLRGIALVRLKEYEAAQIDLANADGAFEIEFNRKIAALLQKRAKENEIIDWIERQTLAGSRSIQRSAPVGIEQSMNGLSLPLPDNLPVDQRKNLPKPNLVHFQYNAFNGLHVYKILLKKGAFQVIQGHSTVNGLATAQGIRHGDPIRKMKEKYGNPSRLVPVSGGHFYCYDKVQIYFRTRDNIVEDWLIYQKNTNSE